MVRVVIESVDDCIVAEVDLLTLVAVAGEVMPGVTLDGILQAARGAVVREEGAIGTEPEIQSGADNVVRGGERVCAA